MKILSGKTKKIMLFCAALTMLFALCHPVPADAAGIEERIMSAWSKSDEYSDGEGGQHIRLRVTYYSAEYVEALVRSEAEKNLWTQDEEDSYKYNLLKTLNLDENIAFHFEFDVTGMPAYLEPFDRHLKLYVGRATLEPSDYDKRFNFKLSGQRDGMVWFPRYDPKTGNNRLEGVNNVRLEISGSISQATTRTGDIRFVWDITKDDPSVLNSGPAAARLEIDRLIKRIEKLRTDQKTLQDQLTGVNAELAEVNGRVDELQRQ